MTGEHPARVSGPAERGAGGRWPWGRIGSAMLLAIVLPCVVALPWSIHRYDLQWSASEGPLASPTWLEPFGSDGLGRSLLWRCLLGGVVSLGIGAAAAAISVGIGVTWGAVSGYAGGRVDSAMMRIVDVLYGLPYILLVVLVNLALGPSMNRGLAAMLGTWADERAIGAAGDVATLLIAIGGVSWLTMARVIRGQVLSLRAQPFVEAARSYGASPVRIIARHLLPNLVAPIVVYATLTVPVAILQESFLSFLGIGVQPPLPSWGNLASDGIKELHALATPGMRVRWWVLFFPCLLLGLTLLGLNLLGDALRDRLDPRR